MILVSKKESYSNNFVKIIFGGQETKKLLYRVFETFIMCMPSHICWGWAGGGLANYSMCRFLVQNRISVLSYYM